MNKITIHHNPLKMLAEQFMHLQLSVDGLIDAGQSYECVHPKYGRMGVVKCINKFVVQLIEVKPAVLMMDGDIQFTSRKRNEGKLNTTATQVCIMQFTERSDTGFQKLCETEFARINIHIVHQPSLFA